MAVAQGVVGCAWSSGFGGVGHVVRWGERSGQMDNDGDGVQDEVFWG